jgi:hypothetical protein
LNEDDQEGLAERLEASGRYRVLRGLEAVEVSQGDLASIGPSPSAAARRRLRRDHAKTARLRPARGRMATLGVG